MTSVGLSLFSYQDDARSNKHKLKNLVISKCQEATVSYFQLFSPLPSHSHSIGNATVAVVSKVFVEIRYKYLANKNRDPAIHVTFLCFSGKSKRIVSSFSVTVYSMRETKIWLSFEIFRKNQIKPSRKI